MTTRFERQLKFLIEIDKMKTILRQTLLTDSSRRENDAEHSWHFAVMTAVFFEYADVARVDLNRVLKMALFHDLVEIYAGDTYAFDEKAYEDKNDREALAADRIFSMLPEDQADEFRALWEEFEVMETPDAKYAAAIDRLQPFIHNTVTEGHTWRLGHVTRSKVLKRMAVVEEASPTLWSFVLRSIEDAIKKGYLLEDE